MVVTKIKKNFKIALITTHSKQMKLITLHHVSELALEIKLYLMSYIDRDDLEFPACCQMPLASFISPVILRLKFNITNVLVKDNVSLL